MQFKKILRRRPWVSVLHIQMAGVANRSCVFPEIHTAQKRASFNSSMRSENALSLGNRKIQLEISYAISVFDVKP